MGSITREPPLPIFSGLSGSSDYSSVGMIYSFGTVPGLGLQSDALRVSGTSKNWWRG